MDQHAVGDGEGLCGGVPRLQECGGEAQSEQANGGLPVTAQPVATRMASKRGQEGLVSRRLHQEPKRSVKTAHSSCPDHCLHAHWDGHLCKYACFNGFYTKPQA
jgi:hypothetical protein